MKKSTSSKKGGLLGIDEVMKNLNDEVKKIEGRTMKGLILAGILIRRDMEDTSPKIPVDLGNLRTSWFTVTSTGQSEQTKTAFKGEKSSELQSNHILVVTSARKDVVGKRDPVLVLGFTANYAMFVHENVDAQFFGRPGKKPGRPGSGAKFFESALKRNKDKILKIIADNAKIQ